VRTVGNRVQAVTENFVRDVLLAVTAEVEAPPHLQPGAWLHGAPPGAVGPYLATPGGVLDLGRLGEPAFTLIPNSADFFTLSALAVTPDRAAACGSWQKFLDETFGGDAAATALLQEAFGYSLWSHDCRYEKMFLFYGPAASGKSTVVETLQNMLG